MSLGAVDLPSPPISPSHDPLQDVFNVHDSSTPVLEPSSHPSSITKLQRVHFNDGYREGISNSKGTHVQDGFDEGYPLGAELALRAGVLLGALKELCNAVELSVERLKKENRRPEIGQDEVEATEPSQILGDLQSVLAKARRELAVQCVFSKEYFDEEGIWRWDVDHHADVTAERRDSASARTTEDASIQAKNIVDEDRQITFREIAEAHPLIVKWRDATKQWLLRFGLDGAGFSWKAEVLEHGGLDDSTVLTTERDESKMRVSS